MKQAKPESFIFLEPVAMQYQKGKHSVFYHRYHVVWITKYRFKVLKGAVQQRVREIIRQVCNENDVEIISGVLSSDHVHMFVSIPPKLSVSDFLRKVKGRSSHKVQLEFPALKKRYWGCHFWGRGYFSTTSGALTDDVILQYLENHIDNPTDASR
jgi:putative transposase